MIDLENAEDAAEMIGDEATLSDSSAPQEFFFPWWAPRASGLYARPNEELRLDVDGRYPQMTASGVIRNGLTASTHWIANVSASGSNEWSGAIWFKDGLALPFTQVRIQVVRSWFVGLRKATVTLSGGGAPDRVREFHWKSRYFHAVEFEFDTVQGTTAVTQIETCDHPNRPSIPCETLSIEKVYRRSGFDVSNSGGNNVIPSNMTGADGVWSDMEMHDAMQAFWSRFDNRAQWSLWVLFASLHERGSSLGGIMFDDIGPNHRQGTAIFNDTFIANAPNGDPAPDAWVRRMKFWTAVHEMGHGFNLAHAWQKAASPLLPGNPWIPLSNEPESRSFMNYPFRVIGGQSAFFADFQYRFSDQELLFMRHAPARFVQMGNADWFDDHGFQQEAASRDPSFRLELRVHRTLERHFEYLEPVKVEAKLTNISRQPQLVADSLLEDGEGLTVILKKTGKRARQWVPFAQRCFESSVKALQPGESKYGSMFVGAGLNGWDIAEPGVYHVQAAAELGDEGVISNTLEIRVHPPKKPYEEERLAQDFFSEDVGRVLAMGGTRFLAKANEALEEVSKTLAGTRAAHHARLALGNPYTRRFKSLDLRDGTTSVTTVYDDKGKIAVEQPKIEEAQAELRPALIEDAGAAAETIGHIDYKRCVDRFSDFLADEGDAESAEKCQTKMQSTLRARDVLPRVLDDIERRKKAYAGTKSKKKSRSARAGR